MNDHKGRAFGYIFAFLSGWVIVRTALFSPAGIEFEPKPESKPNVPRSAVLKKDAPQKVGFDLAFARGETPESLRFVQGSLISSVPVGMQASPQWPTDTALWVRSAESPKTADLALSANVAQDAARPLPMPSPLIIAPPIMMATGNSPELATKPRMRPSYYAYGFWRPDISDNRVVNSGQYFGPFAGSQTGLVAEFPLQIHYDGTPRLGVIARGYLVPREFQSAEIGAGLKWRPMREMPISLVVESRFRGKNAPRLAAYAVIAPPALKLSKSLTVNSYAQLGAITGKDGVRFLDANAYIDTPILTRSKITIKAGPLTSVSAQSDLYRLELGPLVYAEMPLGKKNVRIAADWRFQIAGDIGRKAGPTLTLSTSF